MDVSYGGENGFNQAIELSAESLSNVKFIQEKKLIGRYFDEISQVGQRFTKKKIAEFLVFQWQAFQSDLKYRNILNIWDLN